MSLDGQARLSAKLQGIAAALKEVLEEEAGEPVMFSLLIWGEGEDERAQYISNAEREGVKAAMQELLDRWAKTGGDDGPYHVYRRSN